MATQGLFTQLPSVDELLQQRNKRSTDLQQTLMQNAAQGARDPAKARAVSFLGSTLGRALGDSMGGADKQLDERQAAIDAQKEAQGKYFDAASQQSSEKIFEYAKTLRDTYPAAAVKLIEIGNARRIEEQDIAKDEAALALVEQDKKDQAAADQTERERVQAEVERVEGVAKGIRVEKRVEQLRKEGVELSAARLKATAEESKNQFTVISGKEYNEKNGTSLSENSMWKVKNNGDLVQIDKKSKSNVMQKVPEGMTPTYDKETGQIIKLSPIIGGKQWSDAQDAAAAMQAGVFQDMKTDDQKQTQANVVNTAIDDALALAATDDNTTLIFGPLGAAAALVAGSARSNLEALMKPIEADAAFATLQAMREASKTGGALGQVSDKEIELLKNARGALSRSQSKEQFIQNLERYKETYNGIINGSAAYIKKVEAYRAEILANKVDPNATATYRMNADGTFTKI